MTSLFENATEGIILTNGRGNIELVNPAAERMFGYATNELNGQPVEILIPGSLGMVTRDCVKVFIKSLPIVLWAPTETFLH